jgi:Protein of unknown function (DUF1559)
VHSSSIGDLGTLNYRGVSGESPFNANSPCDTNNFMQGIDGVMSSSGGIDDRDITDGMSQTLMFGESRIGLWGDSFSATASVVDGQPLFDSFLDAKVLPNPICSYPPPYYVYYAGFGSFHGDIANFSLADASARSITKTIDRELFKNLCTRNGNERVSDEF